MPRVAIAIGSNLGDRHAAVAFAAERLSALLTGLTLSDVIETEPDGEGLQDQPLYLNAVAVGETTLTARQLLDALLAIERDFGRERPFPGAPRTLDLDLILLGDDASRTSRASRCRIRGSASASSCSGRWRRWRRTWSIR